jgi:magnesium chelatase subunit D
LELVGETEPQLPEDFLQRVADERSLLTTFQEEGMEYDDPSGDFGSPGEESNASDVEDEFPDGMPTAIENARRMEGAEIDDERSGDEGEDETGEHSEEQSREPREDQGERQEDNPDEQRGPSPPQGPDLADEDLYGYSGDER